MRQSSRGSRQHRSKIRTRIIVGLSLGLFLMTVTAVILSFKLDSCGRDMSDLLVKEGKQARRLAELEPKLVDMELEIAALVKSRLPHLLPLEFDKVFTLNQDYARNIVFSISGKRGKNSKKHYEYKLVMDNLALTPIHPHIQIILFDRDGVQVGFSEFGVDKEGVPTLDILEHDESRSQTGEVIFTDEAEPRYFTVRLKH
jgi:hypothetical protein